MRHVLAQTGGATDRTLEDHVEPLVCTLNSTSRLQTPQRMPARVNQFAHGARRGNQRSRGVVQRRIIAHLRGPGRMAAILPQAVLSQVRCHLSAPLLLSIAWPCTALCMETILRQLSAAATGRNCYSWHTGSRADWFAVYPVQSCFTSLFASYAGVRKTVKRQFPSC